MELAINEWHKVAGPDACIEVRNTGVVPVAYCFCKGKPQSEQINAENYVALNSDDHYLLGIDTEPLACGKPGYSLYARPLGGVPADITINELAHA